MGNGNNEAIPNVASLQNIEASLEMAKLDTHCSSVLLIEVTESTDFLALMNRNGNDGCAFACAESAAV